MSFVAFPLKSIFSFAPLVTTPSLCVPLVSEMVPIIIPLYDRSPSLLMEKLPEMSMLISSPLSLLSVIFTSNLALGSQSALPSGSLAVAVESMLTGMPPFWSSV